MYKSNPRNILKLFDENLVGGLLDFSNSRDFDSVLYCMQKESVLQNMLSSREMQKNP